VAGDRYGCAFVSTVAVAAQAHAEPRRSHAQRIAQLALLAAPLGVAAIAAWHYRWLSDDGFINLRVVRQLQAGNGPVFNAGERVEASTSPLWIAVLTLADVLLPVRLEWLSVAGGIIATVTGLALVLAGATALTARRATRGLIAPTGIWMLVAFTPTWKFASGGLENGLFALWFGASFFLLARWTSSSHGLPSWVTAVLVGLGPLVRPDVAIMSLGLLGAVVVCARAPAKQTVAFIAAALTVPILFQLFRMGYYDSLVPNPALAKEATRSWWSQGWRYLGDAVGPYWLWIPLSAIAVGGYVPLCRAFAVENHRRSTAIVLACLLSGLVHAFYITRVGGDFMNARLLLPGLTAIVAPVAVTRIDRSVSTWLMPIIVIGWALVAAGWLRSPADAPITFFGTPRNAVTTDDHGWQRGGPGRAWFTGTGIYFNDTPIAAPPNPELRGPAVASFGVGLAAYTLGTDVYVLDMLGLGDPLAARLRLDERGVVAHEKPLPIPWVAARLVAPEAPVQASDFPMPEFFVARPLDEPRGSFGERVDAARIASSCGQLARLNDRIDGPLSVSGFLANIWHAFGDTRLRVPPEPADAVRRFC
jgi:arabinofuranosyltransferase